MDDLRALCLEACAFGAAADLWLSWFVFTADGFVDGISIAILPDLFLFAKNVFTDTTSAQSILLEMLARSNMR